MFDEAVLTEAVEIHQRCYRLLLWVGDAIQREFIPITRARISTRANAKPPKSGFPSLSRTCQLSRVVALAAYGRELLYRCQGQGKSGPAVLALWREFAEEPTGSPIPRFQLQARDIVHAERKITEVLLG